MKTSQIFIITFGVVIGLAILVGGIVFGSLNGSRIDQQNRTTCVEAGGDWVPSPSSNLPQCDLKSN